MNNEEELLKKLNPELYRVYKAMKNLMENYGGTGDIEIHLFQGRIKVKNGLYIKPAWTDESDVLNEIQK